MSNISAVVLNGPQQILNQVYDSIGFNRIRDEVLRHLVIARICQPLSKSATADYLKSYFHEDAGSFQTGFSYQQTAPQQPAQATQPFTPMSQGAPAVPAVPQGTAFAAQPSNYTPLFNSNGQVTGQTGAFHPVPQNPAMETDSHGVPTFMKKNR